MGVFVADQAQVCLGVLFVPAVLEFGGVAAEGGLGVADVQAGTAGGGLTDEFVGAGEQDTGAGEYLHARGGGCDAAAGAVQESHPEQVLEGGKGAGDGSLGGAEFVGGVGESAGVDDGDQAPQVFQFQDLDAAPLVIRTPSVSVDMRMHFAYACDVPMVMGMQIDSCASPPWCLLPPPTAGPVADGVGAGWP